jgi:hypothetical protein
MNYSMFSTLHGALILEVIHHHLRLFLTFLRGTNAWSIQVSIIKLPQPRNLVQTPAALPFFNDRTGLT